MRKKKYPKKFTLILFKACRKEEDLQQNNDTYYESYKHFSCSEEFRNSTRPKVLQNMKEYCEINRRSTELKSVYLKYSHAPEDVLLDNDYQNIESMDVKENGYCLDFQEESKHSSDS